MAYNEFEAERIRTLFSVQDISFSEKKMMGGLCFMVDDKMCVGLDKDKEDQVDRLLVRMDPVEIEKLLKNKHVCLMLHSGKPMQGFIFVRAPAFRQDHDLAKWIKFALDFNPLARSSKKNN